MDDDRGRNRGEEVLRILFVRQIFQCFMCTLIFYHFLIFYCLANKDLRIELCVSDYENAARIRKNL